MTSPSSSKPDPVLAYAGDVLAGRVVAGRLVRLACQRHINDLERGAPRGLRWDLKAALRTIKFFGHLRLAEGQFAGKPFALQPFQQFIIGSLFGWKGANGFRRFRTAYIEIGKGNGKSPLAAGVGLYGLVADNEPSAEVYSAAVTREQAGILFRDAKLIAESCPSLAGRLDTGLYNITYHATNSFFRAVSSEHRGLDGKRPHMALVDEIHEHPNSLVVDKMRAGTKARRQALLFEITNSGVDRESVCWHHHDYSRRILEGLEENDNWFAYVCGLDPCEACRRAGLEFPDDACDDCDKFYDEPVWPKANPGLGAIITHDYLREQVREAKGMPSKEGIVKRLNFCVWTKNVVTWLPPEPWDACEEPLSPEQLKGRTCYAGLDLASTTDTAALVLLFPRDKGHDVLPFCWIPEEACKRRERANKTRMDGWVRAGLIEACPGNTIDYDRIREKVNELNKVYNICEVAIDRWNATHLATQLMGDGFEVVAFGQGYASMSAPAKELEGLVLSGKFRHGGHPVMKWMAGNAAVETDAAGNIKPSKKNSAEKIDLIVAAVMALGRAMVAEEKKASIYETRGIDFVGAAVTPAAAGEAQPPAGRGDADLGRWAPWDLDDD